MTTNAFDPDYKPRQQERQLDPTLAIKAQLSGNERIVWTGKPDPSRVFRLSFVIYLFAIPWTAFSLFWESMALGGIWGSMDKMPEGAGLAMGIVFPLFGLPFIAIGFWMLTRPFAYRRLARDTIFAITSKRAIVFDAGKAQELTGVPLSQIASSFTTKQNADGSGSLLFGGMPEKAGDDRKPFKRGFEYIANVKEAEAALRRAIQNIGSDPT